MSLKTYIQIFLLILIISITVLFFFKYFYTDKSSVDRIPKNPIEEEIILDENIENIIEDLRFERIDVYGNKQTIISLKRRFSYLFENVGTYRPFLKSHIIKKSFSLGERDNKVNFKTIIVKHGRVKTVGYIFENTAYLSDCNDMSIVKRKELKNLNYLIIDCLKIDKNSAHFNLDESLIVHRSLKPKKTFLTNLHHELDYDFLLKNLPKDILPAYDGLKLNL